MSPSSFRRRARRAPSARLDWSIGDESFGRLQCAPQQVGIRFDWTDTRLSILSTLIDFDGDYQTTFQTWLEAGPNP